MRTIYARNVNEAYALGMNMLKNRGILENSRVGSVLAMPCPVTTTYTNPMERVLFDAKRDANPFFHLMEGLWMLGGRNDVAWMDKYNSGFKKYSDDGKIYHGAYGHRWRHHFDGDQIKGVIELLRRNPRDRRCIIQMWDPDSDLGFEGVDFPCNLSIALRVREDLQCLDLTVFNRSNDIVWGTYGANAVHMSMLQEYLATAIGVSIGTYYQVSNNYHAYTDILKKISCPNPGPYDPYSMGTVKPYTMVQDARTWDTDLKVFLNDPTQKQLFSNMFFYDVAIPMAQCSKLFKEGDLMGALTNCTFIQATDWQRACQEWLKRRILRKGQK